jgi:ribosomal protein L29
VEQLASEENELLARLLDLRAQRASGSARDGQPATAAST